MKHTPGPWTLRDDRLSPQVWVETVTGATRIVRFGARENWDAIDHGNANLIAAAPDLLDAAQLARAALMHDVPADCWATGPSTGDAIQDLVVCPGCAAIAAIDKAVTKGRPPKKVTDE